MLHHTSKIARNRDERHGAALVEFALVGPLLFLFMLASLEFSHLTTLRNTANNAAYEAARVAVVPGATSSEADREARRILGVVGVRNYDLQVSDVNPGSNEVTVTINIPYANNALSVPLFLKNSHIRSQSTLRTERYSGIPSLTP